MPASKAAARVISRDFGQNSQYGIIAGFGRALHRRGRCFERTTFATEDIDFPGRVEASIIDVVFERKIGRQGQRSNQRLVRALQLPRGRNGDTERRPEVGFAAAPDGACLTEVGFRYAHVQVRLRGALDQRVQLGIVERGPPGRGGGGRVDQSSGDGRTPGGGCVRGDRAIIRPDRAASREGYTG